MKLRIAHVVRQYFPSVGGMEGVVANIARMQHQQYGHTPTIITLDRLFRGSPAHLIPSEMVEGIPVIRLPYVGSTRYPVCLQVLKQIRDVDVVHVHGIDFFFDYLALTKRFHQRPMIATTHGGFFHTNFASSLKKVFFNTVTRLSSRAYQRIIASSANDGAGFSRIAGDRVVTIENGVDVEKYFDQAAMQPERTLIYFGRWSSNKGLPELINLFHALVQIEPRWKLIIAGRAYDLSKAQLQELVQQAGLQQQVTIHDSPDDDSLRGLIGQASYYACLSHHEGFGLAAIEAMSAGLTPILSDIAPFRKVIQESGAGLLVNANNHQETSRSLLTLHEEMSAKFFATRDQLQTFASRYHWKHAIAEYENQYQLAVR